MKFALVVCLALLEGPYIQANGHHHHKQEHHHQPEHHHHLVQLQPQSQHHHHHQLPSQHHHYQYKPVVTLSQYHPYHQHHHKHHDNIGASIETSYFGSASLPSSDGQQQCMGSYSGSNVFIHPASGSYETFARKVKPILEALMEFISRPVEFACLPGSALNLDVQSRIMNHRLPCSRVCDSEGTFLEVPTRTIITESTTEMIPMDDCSEPVIISSPPITSDCCNQPVQVVPVEVAPVKVKPVHVTQVREPVKVLVEQPPKYREVVYEEPVMEPRVYTQEVVVEEPEEDLHALKKQLHHLMHNQKKHHHHHHHHH